LKEERGGGNFIKKDTYFKEKKAKPMRCGITRKVTLGTEGGRH